MLGRYITTAALALSLSACGTAAFTGPEEGGATWRELRTDGFVLQTDLSEYDAWHTIREFERTRRAFREVAYPHQPKPNGTTHVVIFARKREWNALTNAEWAGLFRTGQGVFPELVLTRGKPSAEFRRVLAHELSHRFTAFYFPNAPLWLNEGMADYYETLRIDGRSVVVGEPPGDVTFSGSGNEGWGWNLRKAYAVLPVQKLPSLGELFEMGPDEFYGPADERSSPDWRDRRRLNYATAWITVHALRHSSSDTRERFVRYLTLLNAGELSPKRSWQRAFRGYDYERLRELRNRYAAAGKLGADRVDRAIDSRVAVESRELSPAETRLVWARARSWDYEQQRFAALADLKRAIELDPKLARAHAVAAVLLGRAGRRDDALRAARRAVKLEPEAPFPRLVLGTLLTYAAPSAETKRELRRTAVLLSRYGQTPGELDFVARYLLLEYRPMSALKMAAKAIRADFSCSYCYETAALAYAMLERWSDAATATRTALNLVPERERGSRTDLEQRYEKFVRIAATAEAPGSADGNRGEGNNEASPHEDDSTTRSGDDSGTGGSDDSSATDSATRSGDDSGTGGSGGANGNTESDADD